MLALTECRRESLWKISGILSVYSVKDWNIQPYLFLWHINGYSSLSQSQQTRLSGSCVKLSSSVLSFIPLTPCPIRELPSVCAGDLWSGGAGVVHCQGLHCGEATHHPREDLLHLWLWSVHPTILQRQVRDAWFTTRWCEQAWATSCKTGTWNRSPECEKKKNDVETGGKSSIKMDDFYMIEAHKRGNTKSPSPYENTHSLVIIKEIERQ